MARRLSHLTPLALLSALVGCGGSTSLPRMVLPLATGQPAPTPSGSPTPSPTPGADLVLSADPLGNQVSVFAITTTGDLSLAQSAISLATPGDANPRPQAIVYTPDHAFAYVLGTREVFALSLAGGTVTVLPNPLPIGSASATCLGMDPDGRFLYLAGPVAVQRAVIGADGSLSALATLSGMPAGVHVLTTIKAGTHDVLVCDGAEDNGATSGPFSFLIDAQGALTQVSALKLNAQGGLAPASYKGQSLVYAQLILSGDAHAIGAFTVNPDGSLTQTGTQLPESLAVVNMATVQSGGSLFVYAVTAAGTDNLFGLSTTASGALTGSQVGVTTLVPADPATHGVSVLADPRGKPVLGATASDTQGLSNVRAFVVNSDGSLASAVSLSVPADAPNLSPKVAGEKDPASDKPGDKDPSSDKDPTTDKTTDKDPTTDKTTDKDPTTDKTSDKDPNEKTSEGQLPVPSRDGARSDRFFVRGAPAIARTVDRPEPLARLFITADLRPKVPPRPASAETTVYRQRSAAISTSQSAEEMG